MRNRKFLGNTWLSPLLTALLMSVGCFVSVQSAFVSLSGYSGFSSLRNGMALLANTFLTFLTEKSGHIHVLYDCVQNADYLWGVVAICELCAFAIAWACMHGTFLPALAPTILILAGYLTGFLKSGVGLLLYVFGLVLLLISRNSKKAQTTKNFLYALVCVVLTVSVLGGSIRLAVPELHAERNVQKVQDILHTLRYDIGRERLPHGNLQKAMPTNNGKTVLRVETNGTQKLYLRAFAATDYDGKRWRETSSKTLAEYNELFYWLHENGFYVEKQMELSLGTVNLRKASEVTVENISACKASAYLPASGSSDAVLDETSIGSTIGTGVDGAYTASVLKSDLGTLFSAQKTLATRKSEGIDRYLKFERSYAKFVKDTSLTVPKNVRQTFDRQLRQDFFDKTLTEKIAYVLKILDTFVYSDDPGTYQGEDAMVWFMEQSDSGNAVQLASAATLLLRYLGVPARYVEGYLVPKGESGEILVTNENAHAWAEYYLDGVGWVPMEAIAGISIEDEEFYADGEDYENDLQDTTPPAPVDEEEEELPPEVHTKPREISIPLVISGVLSIPILLIALWILILRLRLRKRMTDIRKMDTAKRVPNLYAYAEYVREKCEVTPDEKRREEARKLNEEALFSAHEIGEEQAEKIENYLSHTVEKAKQKSMRRRILDRFWDGIY